MMKAAKLPSESWLAYYKRTLTPPEAVTQEVREFLDAAARADDREDAERFMALSILTPDGGLHLPMLFDYDVRPQDRRYLLRRMEATQEAYIDLVVSESRGRKLAALRDAADAAAARDMHETETRLLAVQERLARKTRMIVHDDDAMDRRGGHATSAVVGVTGDENAGARMMAAPDFPTTFSVCRRLHASPARARAPPNQTQQQTAGGLVRVSFAVSTSGALERVTTALSSHESV